MTSRSPLSEQHGAGRLLHSSTACACNEGRVHHRAWIHCLQIHRATPGAASWCILLSAVRCRRWGQRVRSFHSTSSSPQHDGGSMDRAAVYRERYLRCHPHCSHLHCCNVGTVSGAAASASVAHTRAPYDHARSAGHRLFDHARCSNISAL